MELLAAKIRKTQILRAFPFRMARRSKFYSLLTTENVESLKSHLQILDRFGNASGLKLNKKKTKAMWMGSMKDRRLKVLDFKTTKEPIKSSWD